MLANRAIEALRRRSARSATARLAAPFGEVPDHPLVARVFGSQTLQARWPLAPRVEASASVGAIHRSIVSTTPAMRVRYGDGCRVSAPFHQSSAGGSQDTWRIGSDAFHPRPTARRRRWRAKAPQLRSTVNSSENFSRSSTTKRPMCRSSPSCRVQMLPPLRVPRKVVSNAQP